jgi:hypothetical protein
MQNRAENAFVSAGLEFQSDLKAGVPALPGILSSLWLRLNL